MWLAAVGLIGETVYEEEEKEEEEQVVEDRI